MAKNKQKKSKPKSKKKPVTSVACFNPKSKQSRDLISKLHQLNKEKEKEACAKDSAKITELEEEIEKYGGLDAYQKVSKAGEHLHGNYTTAKWIVEQLKGHKIQPPEGKKLSLLDVGALDLNYKSQGNWIQSTAIDLNPQKPGIIQANFLKYKNGETDIYDIVVLSLVVNFVGCVLQRGQMISHAKELCKKNGNIFIILPLACVENSRYMTHELLLEMMESQGCELIKSHNSHKLSFKMFQKKNTVKKHRPFPKKKRKNGKKMNNFCIVIQ